MSANNESIWSPEEVVEIAAGQRFLIRLILLQIGNVFLFFVGAFGGHSGPFRIVTDLLGVVSLAGWIAIAIFGILGIYRLAKSLRKGEPIIYAAVGIFVPLIGLLLLLSLSSEATVVMQKNGIHVGVMGPNPEDLERLKSGVSIAA